MRELNCVFRRHVRMEQESEVANCGLVQQVLGVPENNAEVGLVHQSACEQCCSGFPLEAFRYNPVLPSILFGASHQLLLKGASALNITAIEQIRDWTEKVVLTQQAERDQRVKVIPHLAHGTRCDVILCLEHADARAKAAIDSVLDQLHALPVVHLIYWDEGGESLAKEYAADWRVRCHAVDSPRSPLAATHELMDRLESPFVAIQLCHSISLPERISASLRQLIDTGAEFFFSPIWEAHRVRHCEEPSSGGGLCSAPAESMVFRRGTFYDVGGAGVDCADDFTDFIERGHRLKCPWIFGLDPLVRSEKEGQIVSWYSSTGNLSRSNAPPVLEVRQAGRGFAASSVACDVVMPIFRQAEFAEQALKSVLEQNDADVVVHLINDASPDPQVRQFFRRWIGHPQVRTYQNIENIGQYSSINNVVPHLETDFMAIQDADDISLPHRVSESINMLNWTGADLFGGAVEQFGDEEMWGLDPNDKTQAIRKATQRHRFSSYPGFGLNPYFLVNPTACFRVATFLGVGGYTDLGGTEFNRSSLDTEFQMRCRFSGVPIAVTRRVVTRYRIHAESATQNRSTGWGSPTRQQTTQRVKTLCQLYRHARFDPRQYGALGRYSHLTRRVTRPEECD